MASPFARVSIRLTFVVLILFAAFYIGRPLYWKLSATIHEIRAKKKTVQQGISQFVREARRSVGWVRDESDPGSMDEKTLAKATVRRFLRN